MQCELRMEEQKEHAFPFWRRLQSVGLTLSTRPWRKKRGRLPREKRICLRSSTNPSRQKILTFCSGAPGRRLSATVAPPSRMPRNWGAPFSTLPESLTRLTVTVVLTCLVLDAAVQCIFFLAKFLHFFQSNWAKFWIFFSSVNSTNFAIFGSKSQNSKNEKKNIAPILHSHFLTHTMFLELLLFSSHIWMVFLTMEPSQEPCFQAPKNTFNAKV
jgi:hypothetical protein